MHARFSPEEFIPNREMDVLLRQPFVVVLKDQPHKYPKIFSLGWYETRIDSESNDIVFQARAVEEAYRRLFKVIEQTRPKHILRDTYWGHVPQSERQILNRAAESKDPGTIILGINTLMNFLMFLRGAMFIYSDPYENLIVVSTAEFTHDHDRALRKHFKTLSRQVNMPAGIPVLLRKNSLYEEPQIFTLGEI